MGNKDLGRDVIAYNDREVYIIQCKCWSSDSRIHENIICQLYGTTEAFKKTGHINKRIVPVLYTTTQLTETAKYFAKILGVKVCIEPMNWDFDYSANSNLFV